MNALDEIKKVLETFDNNVTIFEIMENGEINTYISAQDYLYLKTKLQEILKGEKNERNILYKQTT